MNNSDLDKVLKSARVPERPEEYWETFPGRVRGRLAAVERGERAASGLRWPGVRLSWWLAGAAACVAVILVIGQWYRAGRVGESLAALQDGKVLNEVLAMFPNRVRAITEDKNGVHLTLSDQADVPVSTPYWIQVCDGKQCRAVVTFSGQSLQIAGEEVEVLVDAQGKLMLVGDQFVWSSADSNSAVDHLRIQARPLSAGPERMKG